MKHFKKLMLICTAAVLAVMLSACSFLIDTGTSRGLSGPKATVTGTSFTMKDVPDSAMLSRQEVAQKIMPSVVTVLTYTTSSAGYSSSGSGVLFLEQDSRTYIITNAHVVENQTALKVVMHDDTVYTAFLQEADPTADLAVIFVEKTGLTVAEFANADTLMLADDVMTAGSPGGLEFKNSVTVGIVSGLNRKIETISGYSIECIQTDAAINPGNSGGALVNMYGQVVGINTAKIAAVEYESMGFAIAINDNTQSIIAVIMKKEVPQRAALGISYTYIDETASATKTPPWKVGDDLIVGMYIAGITNPSLTDNGLKAEVTNINGSIKTYGDVITKIGGTKITQEAISAGLLKNYKPGDTVELEYYRPATGKLTTVTVELTQAS